MEQEEVKHQEEGNNAKKGLKLFMYKTTIQGMAMQVHQMAAPVPLTGLMDHSYQWRLKMHI